MLVKQTTNKSIKHVSHASENKEMKFNDLPETIRDDINEIISACENNDAKKESAFVYKLIADLQKKNIRVIES